MEGDDGQWLQINSYRGEGLNAEGWFCRKAEMERDTTVTIDLTEKVTADGVIRADKVITKGPRKVRMGFYALPELDKPVLATETKVKGSTKKTFPDPETINKIFFGSVKTYGGTENYNNNVYTVYDTATVETWYRPDITSDCRIYICGTGETWNVISRPEDIDMRHQFMQFKAQKVGGKP